MRCSRAEELMSLSLDGAASASHTREMEDHLRSCARCLRQWRSLGQVSALLQAPRMAKPAGGFTEAVMQRIERMETAPANTGHSTGMYFIVALIAISLLAAGNVLLVADAYIIGLPNVPILSAGELASLVWKLVPIIRLLWDIGWSVTSWLATTGQGTLFPLALSLSLVLAALWAHVLKNYRGVEVGQ